ncbi:MAG: trehalase family glycosidase [Acidobacteriota bacterium]
MDSFLPDVLIGRLGKAAEQVRPGPHAWDGSYTSLELTWRGTSLRIESAHAGDDLVLLVTPLASQPKSYLPPTLIFSVNFLWNRPGSVVRISTGIEAHGPMGTVPIFCVASNEINNTHSTCPDIDVNTPVTGPFLAADVTGPVAISTGHARTLAQIQSIVDQQHHAYQHVLEAAGPSAPLVEAIQAAIAWNTIYEPEEHRVITPVARGWSNGWGGYVLFDWDTFFAASLSAVGSRDLAYANALEILRSETPAGFVPNFARGGGWKSFDRSEPPVGAITVLSLYQKFHDRWFIADAFVPLLRWNRWWSEHRSIDGYLTWGSDDENRPENIDDSSIGKRDGAVLESGLDNSPMYDGATYNSQTHQLEFADVGLMGMYIADCDALATMAEALGKTGEAAELRDRSRRYRSKLATLWSEKDGIFLNKDLHTGEFSHRLSPTNFYPLLGEAATQQQADRMIREHLLNTNEFWGQYVLPSIARNDPAFKDQKYWRGRIWGPLNYLVYLGLRKYASRQVTDEFAQKSNELFQQVWTANRHVHENYNANTGLADEVDSSDRFYHWGALLELIPYMQQTEPPKSGTAK